MKQKLIIIGAGGHGKVVEEIAFLNGYKEILFLDDNKSNVKVIGKISEFSNYISSSDFVVAIGDNALREKVFEGLKKAGVFFATLVHPSAVISDSAHIGNGTVVMAGAVINSEAYIGENVIINTCSSVDHNCTIGKSAHIAVGTHLCGTVLVGKRSLIGAGATVINNCKICDDCTIGAGAVVIRNIVDSSTCVGNPCRRIK